MKTNTIKHIVFTSIVTLIFWNCTNETNLKLDYCEMLELDQSFVENDGSEKQIKSNHAKRKKGFKENFERIIQYSKYNGFPEMGSLQTSGVDSCRNWVVMITLFHVGQTQPKLFFENETKQLLEKEIMEGRLESGSLFPPLREGFKNHEFCLTRQDQIHNALIAWNLKIEDLPKIKFVDCLK